MGTGADAAVHAKLYIKTLNSKIIDLKNTLNRCAKSLHLGVNLFNTSLLLTMTISFCAMCHSLAKTPSFSI